MQFLNVDWLSTAQTESIINKFIAEHTIFSVLYFSYLASFFHKCAIFSEKLPFFVLIVIIVYFLCI